jgi:hypothetical protein
VINFDTPCPITWRSAEGDDGVTFKAQRAGANAVNFSDLMKGALKP